MAGNHPIPPTDAIENQGLSAIPAQSLDTIPGRYSYLPHHPVAKCKKMKRSNIPQTLCLLSLERFKRSAQAGKTGGGRVVAPFKVRKPNRDAG